MHMRHDRQYGEMLDNGMAGCHSKLAQTRCYHMLRGVGGGSAVALSRHDQHFQESYV